MSFDGSGRSQRKVNLSSLGRSPNSRSSPVEDRSTGSSLVDKLKNDRIARQTERRTAEAGEKIARWARRRLAEKRLTDSFRRELSTKINDWDGTAASLMQNIREYLFFMMKDTKSSYESSASTWRLFQATKALATLLEQVSRSLKTSVDLATMLLPKQSAPEEAKAASLRLVLASLFASSLQILPRQHSSDVLLCMLRALIVCSDSSSWQLNNKLGALIPAVRVALIKLASSFTTLEPLKISPIFFYLDIFKRQASISSNLAPEISNAALTLLLRATQEETQRQNQSASFALGTHILAVFLSSGVHFRQPPAALKATLREQGSSLLHLVLPCIDQASFPRQDTKEYSPDDISDDSDPMAISLEPQLFIIANLVDLLQISGESISIELRNSAYKAIGVLIRSISVYRDIQEIEPVLPELQFLWSPSTILQVFTPLFTFAPPPSSASGISSWEIQRLRDQQLNEIHAACDIYMGILLKFPSNYTRIMSALALGSKKKLIMCLWNWLKTHDALTGIDKTGRGVDHRLVNVIWMFLSAYSHLLFIIDDDEFYETQIPLHMTEVELIIHTLKRYIYNCHMRDANAASAATQDEIHLTGVASRLLCQLRDRDLRRPICPIQSSSHGIIKGKDLWSMPELSNLDENSILSDGALQLVLALLPFGSSFQTRYLLFKQTLQADSRNYRDEWFGIKMMKIRRDHLVEDGFEAFSRMSPDALKSHVRVKFVDQFGASEPGIDGGGLSKEFLTDLLKEVFKPSFGLFLEGPDNRLYPNPAALHEFFDFEPLAMYRFLGRLLGKAVYEGLVVDVTFAPFFLKKLLGKATTIDDLETFDPQFYKNLISIKHSSDVESLCLNFTFSQTLAGKQWTHNFIPNGDSIAVTNANVTEYIHYVADFKLNKQCSKQCSAFVIGFREVISPNWLSLFDARELNILIAGDIVTIDVDDMERHAIYNDYTTADKTVRYFWRVLRELSDEDKQLFLKFVTSCPRPPMLGFKHLNPPLRIARSGDDTTRLPSAATCFNMLKLPPYDSQIMLKERLLTAIRNQTGFGLS